VCLLAAFHGELAQAQLCYPKNVTNCCTSAGEQAQEACLEYAAFGFSEFACRSWVRDAIAACQSSCGDCKKIADAVYKICSFSLQVLNDPPVKEKNCGETFTQFLNYRCPIGCDFNATNCTGEHGNPEGDACMVGCGNYAKCNFRMQRGTLRPNTANGPTLLTGPKTLYWDETGRNHSCQDAPLKCRNNIPEGAKCNKYRLCPHDKCLVQQVKCPPLDQCTLPGICEKTEGICFYNNQPDGHPCNDGFDFTINDICINGFCKGTTDNCLKYNVTCPIYSECLSGGICHADSGRCSYSKQEDDYPCNDGRDYTVEDRCQGGFCLGRSVDLCVEQGIDCWTKIPNVCHAPGECDPLTGLCSLPDPLSNRTCDDGDYMTVNDSCIDGLCIGYATANWQEQMFETLGPGQCSDRNGAQLPSYSGDVETEQACETICRNDQQCTAFSYSPPVCSVYGTIRTQPPQKDGRSWSWQGGSVPKAVVVEISELAQGQRESVCRKKNEYGDTVLDDSAGKIKVSAIFAPMMLLGFFFLMMLVFCARPIFRCFRTCLFGVTKESSTENRIVAQNPDTDVKDFRDFDGVQAETNEPPPQAIDDQSPSPKTRPGIWGRIGRKGKNQELRSAAQVGQEPEAIEPFEPEPLELRPDSPDDDPQDLPGSPEQALSPIALPPDPSVSDAGSRQGPPPKKKWSRPAPGQKKEAWKAEEKPPSREQGRVSQEGVMQGPKAAPSSVAGGLASSLGIG